MRARPRAGWRTRLLGAGVGVAVLAAVTAAGPAGATTPTRPCDLYAGRTPCVAAFSTTRALFASYRGPMYQLKRADGVARTIGALRNGYADAAAHTVFCARASCVFVKVFDQTANHNDLTLMPPSTYQTGGRVRVTSFNYVDAGKLPLVVGGHKAYGMYFENARKTGYRNDLTVNVPVGAEPEAMCMVASGRHTSSALFNFGNAETSDSDDGSGTMDAVNLSTVCWFPFGPSMPTLFGQNPPGSQCRGAGPWVQADLENGVFQSATAASSENPDYHGNPSEFVTAMLKNDGVRLLALKGADAQRGPLVTAYAGRLPDRPTPPMYNDLPGYSPMRKQGAIALGTGGDGISSGDGSFFEGVMTRGVPSDAVDNAVQANIVAARYGR